MHYDGACSPLRSLFRLGLTSCSGVLFVNMNVLPDIPYHPVNLTAQHSCFDCSMRGISKRKLPTYSRRECLCVCGIFFAYFWSICVKPTLPFTRYHALSHTYTAFVSLLFGSKRYKKALFYILFPFSGVKIFVKLLAKYVLLIP